MLLQSLAPAHLTYCTNIHPGESWAEVYANVTENVTAVKQLICPTAPFSVGLRLSAEAAGGLTASGALRFRRELEKLGLYVCTLNGFPYGRFHGAAVKESVYRPDWRETPRVDYTNTLADILAALLPPSASFGSISTVPGCFGTRTTAQSDSEIAANLRASIAHVWRIHERGGPELVLALEPEPCCFIETNAQLADYLQAVMWGPDSVQEFAKATGLSKGKALEVLRRHLGACLDTCHAAVEYEEPGAALDALVGAGVRIAKVQVTTGLKLEPVTPEAVAALRPFADNVYLHQVITRQDDALRRFSDLSQAFEAYAAGHAAQQWRVHFHVPVFMRDLGEFANTQEFVVQMLDRVRNLDTIPHLELETYTWDVLPAAYRTASVTEAIARELRWVIEQWNQ